MATQFPYLILLAPFSSLLKKDRELQTWSLIYLGVVAVGVLGLNMTLMSSSYYFSNVNFFVALPLLAILISHGDSAVVAFLVKLKEKGLWLKLFYLLIFGLLVELLLRYTHGALAAGLLTAGIGFVAWKFKVFFQGPTWPLLRVGAIMMFFLCSGVYFLGNRLPRNIKTLQETFSRLEQNASFKNAYVKAFAEVRADRDKGMMLYIPKSEVEFWKFTGQPQSPWNFSQCMSMPFYATILTGKASLYGLPESEGECEPYHRGYESYSEKLFEDSKKTDYTHQELCNEVMKLGFKGYYKVTAETGAVKNLCAAKDEA